MATGWLADIQTLEPGDVCELYDIDLTPLGGSIQRIAPGPIDASGAAVVWQGNTYTTIPIMATGYAKSGKGPFPRPILSIFINDFIRANSKTYNGFRGAKVRRWQVLKKYLDGQSNADPTQFMPVEDYVVSNREAQGLTVLSLNLRSPIDVQGSMIPKRLCTRETCAWPYRRWNAATSSFDYTQVIGCSYTGTLYFDKNGTPTTAANDDCGKRFADCLARFGYAPKPYGGFPGLGRSNVG